MALPMKKIRTNKVKNFIEYKINPRKAPGYNLITGKILKELSQKGLKTITQIYNAILQTEYFPCQWKVGQIIIIVKPGKIPNDITSYRPISLLPTLSKTLEKIFLKRLTPITDESKLNRTSNRLVYKSNNDLESKRYCAAAFIDISQAFEKSMAYSFTLQIQTCFPTPRVYTTEIVPHGQDISSKIPRRIH
jgi:hypothetical protein